MTPEFQYVMTAGDVAIVTIVFALIVVLWTGAILRFIWGKLWK